MRTVKITLQTVLSVALILLLATSIVFTEQAKTYSITTKCSPQAREWIIDKFGEVNTIEELLVDINDFIGTRTYIPKKATDIFQYFDIDEFIDNDCNGLCYDWSCFSAIVAREISQLKGWNCKPYVVDAVSIYDKSIYHSYNFFVVDDENGKRTYYIDTTVDNTRKKSGERITGVVNIANYTMEEFSERCCGYKIFKYH